MTTTTIDAVMIGTPQQLTPSGERSAIRKEPTTDRIAVTATGLDGDSQVYHGHGGSEKAILHFAREHYDTYRQRFSEFLACIDGPRRGFGENISTSGMTEETVCIGDRYRIGPARAGGGVDGDERNEDIPGITVEAVAFRQPCWKLGYNSGVRELPRIMQEEGTTGWYYRVIETGTIATGDEIVLLDRPHPNWTIGEYTRRFYGEPLNREFLEASLAIPQLAENIKEIVRTRLSTGRVEDWTGRLYG